MGKTESELISIIGEVPSSVYATPENIKFLTFKRSRVVGSYGFGVTTLDCNMTFEVDVNSGTVTGYAWDGNYCWM